MSMSESPKTLEICQTSTLLILSRFLAPVRLARRPLRSFRFVANCPGSRLSYPFISPQANLKAPASEITKDVTVPLKYHHAISQQGAFFRTLRNFGVYVDHSALPTKSGIPSRPPAARID